MTRGNQRELARQKAQKRLEEQKKKAGADAKGSNAGLTLEQRRERDAQRLREKQLAKQAAMEAASGGNQKK
jgi:hypothetical protein